MIYIRFFFIDCNYFSRNFIRVVPVEILKRYQARLVSVKKNQLLFDAGENANDYMQVETGLINMYIINPEGQEFWQGVFGAGESFGEPPLLGDFCYPSSARAVENSTIWRLPRHEFLQLLKDNFELHLKLDMVLCKRLQYKSMILTEVSTRDPEHRIKTLLGYLKKKAHVSGEQNNFFPFTRQQLADMTGLRVETVIRTVKKMEKEKKLTLVDHKIMY